MEFDPLKSYEGLEDILALATANDFFALIGMQDFMKQIRNVHDKHRNWQQNSCVYDAVYYLREVDEIFFDEHPKFTTASVPSLSFSL